MIVIQDDKIVFTEFPFPISANAAFRNPSKFENRRCKSKSYAEYDEIFEVYHYSMLKELKEVRKIIKSWFYNFPKTVLNVDLVFYDSKVFNKNDGKIKKSDIFNRIKVAHDKLAILIEIDDCYIFSGNLIRVPSDRHCLEVTVSRSLLL
jgi:hypothetical protein